MQVIIIVVTATLVSILSVLKNKNNHKLNIDIAEIVKIKKLYLEISPISKHNKYKIQDGR